LVFWVRADLGTTIATGVSAWADQSGSGDKNRILAQATGSQQPTLNATDAAYNNQATLSFASASTQFIAGPAAWFSSFATFTIVVVGNVANFSASHAFCGNGGATNEWLYANVSSQFASQNGGAGLLVAGTISPSVVLSTFGADPNSTLSVSTQTAGATGTVGTTDNLGATVFTLGSSGTQSFLHNGKIAEVLIFSKILSASEIKTVMSLYLGPRYAITIGP
jgi:hypothetical protein